VIFGAGHIGQALAPLALNLGFSTFVADERLEQINHHAFDQVQKKFFDLSCFSFADMPIHKNSFLVVAGTA